MKNLIKLALQTNEGFELVTKITYQDELVRLMSYTIQIRNDYHRELENDPKDDTFHWFNYFEALVKCIETTLTQLELSGMDWGDY